MLSLPTRALCRFIIRFALVASLLFLCWCHLAPSYTTTLIAPANWFLEAESAPYQLAQHRHHIELGCRADGALQRLRLRGGETAYLSVVVAAALMLSTPGLSHRRRLAWIAGLTILLWAMQAAMVFAGSYSAFGDFVHAMPPDVAHRWLAQNWPSFSPSLASHCAQAAGAWSAWGAPALILMAWVLAIPSGHRETA